MLASFNPSQNSLLHRTGSEDSEEQNDDQDEVKVWGGRKSWSFSLFRQWCLPMSRRHRKARITNHHEAILQPESPLEETTRQPKPNSSSSTELCSSSMSSATNNTRDSTSTMLEGPALVVVDDDETPAIVRNRPQQHEQLSLPPRSNSHSSATAPPPPPPLGGPPRYSSQSSLTGQPPRNMTNLTPSTLLILRPNRARASSNGSFHRRRSSTSSFCFSVEQMEQIAKQVVPEDDEESLTPPPRRLSTGPPVAVIGFPHTIHSTFDSGLDDDDDDDDDEESFLLSSSDDEDDEDDHQNEDDHHGKEDDDDKVYRAATTEPVADWMTQWATQPAVEAEEEVIPQEPKNSPPETKNEPCYFPRYSKPTKAVADHAETMLAGWACVSFPGNSTPQDGLWYCQLEMIAGKGLAVYLSRHNNNNESQTFHVPSPRIQVEFVSNAAGQSLSIYDKEANPVVSILPTLLSAEQIQQQDVAPPQTGPYAPSEQQDAILHWRFCLDMMLRQQR